MMHLSDPDRSQILLLPEVVDDHVGPDNPVRFIDAFVDGLDLAATSFSRVEPKVTGRPGYPPADLLKLYIYGYLNRVRLSRRLEAETHRNMSIHWPGRSARTARFAGWLSHFVSKRPIWLANAADPVIARSPTTQRIAGRGTAGRRRSRLRSRLRAVGAQQYLSGATSVDGAGLLPVTVTSANRVGPAAARIVSASARR